MSSVSDGAWLRDEVVPLAWCWRITRRDGAVLGLTTHDGDLVVNGLLYRSAPGIRPSAIRQVAGLAGDSMDVEGALSADAIAADELAAGRWDGATIRVAVVNWVAPDAGDVLIAEGVLGDVTIAGAQFMAELGPYRGALDEQIVPATSSECRAELGDRDCRVALAALTWRGSVNVQSGPQVTLDGGTIPDGLRYGRLRWLDGPNRGLTATIADQSGAIVLLTNAPRVPVDPGTRVELIAGCDKRAETCGTRFANIANFRGEPHLPGVDLLTRYPGG